MARKTEESMTITNPTPPSALDKGEVVPPGLDAPSIEIISGADGREMKVANRDGEIGEPAVEPDAQSAPKIPEPQKYQVTRDATYICPFSRSRVSLHQGQIVDPRNQDVAAMKKQGVRLAKYDEEPLEE